jgi:hypothetical protein
MKALSKPAASVFNRIIEGLDGVGSHKKIDNSASAFMALCVEVIDEWAEGKIVSLAHYYEQNGDLMKDPDMTFLVSNGKKFLDGAIIPTSFEMSNPPTYQPSLFYDEQGRLMVRNKAQEDQAKFANTWMRNIKEQQHI